MLFFNILIFQLSYLSMTNWICSTRPTYISVKHHFINFGASLLPQRTRIASFATSLIFILFSLVATNSNSFILFCKIWFRKDYNCALIAKNCNFVQSIEVCKEIVDQWQNGPPLPPSTQLQMQRQTLYLPHCSSWILSLPSWLDRHHIYKVGFPHKL